jgi:hypothetical protein
MFIMSNILGGYLQSLGADLYHISAQSAAHIVLPTVQSITIIGVIVGVGLIAYDVISNRKNPPTIKEAATEVRSQEALLVPHLSPQPERSTTPTAVHGEIPSLVYGKIVVRRWDHKEHGGTYRDSLYILDIVNTADTVALNCQASLDLHNNPEIRDHVALWNKNSSDKISIGHMESLRLFTVSRGNRPVETKLLFDKQSDIGGINY